MEGRSDVFFGWRESFFSSSPFWLSRPECAARHLPSKVSFSLRPHARSMVMMTKDAK